MDEKLNVLKFQILIPSGNYCYSEYVEYSINRVDICHFLKPNENFRIRISNRIITYVSNEIPVESPGSQDLISISDIGTVSISKKWIIDCIDLFFDECRFLEKNNSILNESPTEKATYELFNEQF